MVRIICAALCGSLAYAGDGQHRTYMRRHEKEGAANYAAG